MDQCKIPQLLQAAVASVTGTNRPPPRPGPGRRWGRLGRMKFGALFVEMEEFAEPVERHLAGILTRGKQSLAQRFKEEFNSVFSVVKRRARGFRSFEYLRTRLDRTASKLGLPTMSLSTENVGEPQWKAPRTNSKRSPARRAGH